MSTDPADELFDIVTAEGQPTGLTKPRAQVHRDGDWHRAFHLWLAWRGEDAEPRVLFQRRSPGKDTWAGRLDVAVGGHFRAGETVDDVVREAEEELGLKVTVPDLTWSRTRRTESLQPNWSDRELQEVHLLALEALPHLRPDPVELSAVVQVAISDLERLARGATPVPALQAVVQPDGTLGAWQHLNLTLDDFVPTHDDYWLRGAQDAAHALDAMKPGRARP